MPSATYSVGNVVKPTAPVLKAQWVFRCTTAGTASTEPAWPTANNSTITTGGVTFTNVTGQSTYGWGAAAGDIPTLLGAVGTARFVGGDRMLVSSDHSETQTATTAYGGSTAGAGFTGGQVLSVNRAGSVPPVAADLTPGATCTCSGASLQLEAQFPIYHYGMNYVGSGSQGIFIAASNNSRTTYLDACQLYLSGAGVGARIASGSMASAVLYNSTVRFSHTAQCIQTNGGPMELAWLNTPSALAGAVFPSTQLFAPAQSRDAFLVTARGVDLSAITVQLVANSTSGCSKYLFDSCRIASGVVRYGNVGVVNTRDEVELVNCYDGTSFISERHVPAGDVTTEPTITLTGGATDNVGTFSHKMVSSGTNIDPYVNTLNGFWMDVNYTTTGSAKTATVEIVSSASLNNNEISLILEYLGTSGSSLASMATSLPANVLTTAAAVTTSTATWNSLPATPVRQHLQVTFTPRTAGRVRAQVRLGKPSTTVYYDPQVTIT